MTGAELFGWGIAGAFVSYVVAFLLPELIRYIEPDVRIIPRRVILFAIIMLVFMVVGGLVTWAIGASDNKAAFFTGLGWQGIVKGGAEVADAISKRPKK